MAEHGVCWGGEDLYSGFTDDSSWPGRQGRLQVTFRTTPINTEKNQNHTGKTSDPTASRLQAQGEGPGARRGARCWSLPVAGEAAQHLPPARLKSENYSCSIKADYHPSKPNSIIISMLLLYFCNWKAIIRLPPSLPLAPCF